MTRLCRRSPLRAGVLAMLAIAALAPARADDAGSRLARMRSAALERNYRGTMVFSTGGVVSSSNIAHYSVGTQSYERIDALDGRMQQVLRHNNVVHTLWPGSGVMVIERREAASSNSPLSRTVETRALDQYLLHVEGRQRMAGRDADVLLLAPRDELRYAQRLWADVDSGLMLRAEIIGPDHGVLESSGFSSIELNVKPQPDAVLQPLRQLSQYRVLKAQQEPTQLEAEGWVMARPLPGFVLGSVVRRPLEAAADDAGKADRMVQAMFTDGLTYVSLFIERYDDQRHRKEVSTRIGATATLMQRRGDFWLTAMGDVPPATLKLMLDGLERRP